MTDKELHKLGRRELLQLMLAQGREAEKAKQELAEAQDKLQQLEESYERLKHRLDDKDAQIHKLRAALQSTQGGAAIAGGAGAAVAVMPIPDDYYAPPPLVQRPAPAPQAAAPAPAPSAPSPPVQQPQHPQAQPRRIDTSYSSPAEGNVSVAQRHSRREQEYYDYLFGPVPSQGQQLKKERQRPQSPPQPYREPQAYREPPPYREPQQPREQQPRPTEPRAQYGQWGPPQYMREQPRVHYDVPPQYRYAAYTNELERAPLPPEPTYPAYPPQTPDEFIPEPENPPESSMQMLNAVEIVDGRPVSQSQVMRPKR